MPSGEAGLQPTQAHRSAILPVDVASRQPTMIGVVCTFTIPRKIESKNHAVLPASHKINGLVLVSGKRKGEL
jgi:hypothetical protein